MPPIKELGTIGDQVVEGMAEQAYCILHDVQKAVTAQLAGDVKAEAEALSSISDRALTIYKAGTIAPYDLKKAQAIVNPPKDERKRP